MATWQSELRYQLLGGQRQRRSLSRRPLKVQWSGGNAIDLGLTGKVALVTGASRGIGLAIAEGLAMEGARLAIAARNHATLCAAAAILEGHGAEVLAHTCDIADDAAVTALVAVVEGPHGIRANALLPGSTELPAVAGT